MGSKPIIGAAVSPAPAVTLRATEKLSVESHKSDERYRLTRASVVAVMIYVGGAGLTSLAQMLIAKLVGTASYGIYSYAMAWSTTIGYMAALGLNVALLRLVPSYMAQGRYDLARGVIVFTMQRSFVTAAAAGVVGAAFIMIVNPGRSIELESSLLLGMAAVPLMTTLTIGTALVRAFGGIVRALLPERILRDGLLTILLGMAASLEPWSVDAPLVMKAVLISSSVAVAMVLISAIRLWPANLHGKSGKATQQWWALVPPIMLIAGLDVLISRIGVLVLGWMGDIHNAGIFAIALNVALLVGLPRIAVSVMFSPTAAGLYAHGSHEELQTLLSRASLLSFVGGLVIAVPMLAIVGPLLGWFGHDFSAGVPIARILIFGPLLTGYFGPLQNLLTMTGKEWVAASTMLIGAVANILGCWIGYQTYGAVGAAVGIVIAVFAWNASMAFYIKTRMQILPGPFVGIRTWRFF